MDTRQKVRQQRQLRRAQLVKRVEFVLLGDQARDHAIFEHLAKLTPTFEASEWIKTVLYTAIAGQGDQAAAQEAERPAGQGDQQPVDGGAILAELAALRDAVQQRPPDDSAQLIAALRQEVADLRRELKNRPAPTPARLPDPDASDGSSAPPDPFGGLDSSPRRAGKPKVMHTPAEAAQPATPALDPQAARAQLLASIHAYNGTQ